MMKAERTVDAGLSQWRSAYMRSIGAGAPSDGERARANREICDLFRKHQRIFGKQARDAGRGDLADRLDRMTDSLVARVVARRNAPLTNRAGIAMTGEVLLVFRANALSKKIRRIAGTADRIR